MNRLAQWQAAQDRLERRRWACSALAVLLGGAALLLAGHLRWTDAAPAVPPALPLVVELAPLPQAAAEPSAQLPGPRQQQAPRPRPAPSRALPEPAVPMPAEIALPDARPAEPDAAPEESLPAPQTSAPPGEDAPASSQAAAPQQGARALLASAAQLSFRQRLLGHLQRHKRYPPSAQARRQQGVPYVRFTMDRNGRVLDSGLERGSGHAALDAEALALLQRAQPLPELPAEIGTDTLEIVVPIEFFLKR